MSKLLSKPDDPWTAFLKGSGGAALALGIPLIGGGMIRSWGSGSSLWKIFGFMLAMTAVFSLAAGGLCALWSLVQRWAYDRVTGNPFR